MRRRFVSRELEEELTVPEAEREAEWCYTKLIFVC